MKVQLFCGALLSLGLMCWHQPGFCGESKKTIVCPEPKIDILSTVKNIPGPCSIVLYQPNGNGSSIGVLKIRQHGDSTIFLDRRGEEESLKSLHIKDLKYLWGEPVTTKSQFVEFHLKSESGQLVRIQTVFKDQHLKLYRTKISSLGTTPWTTLKTTERKGE